MYFLGFSVALTLLIAGSEAQDSVYGDNICCFPAVAVGWINITFQYTWPDQGTPVRESQMSTIAFDAYREIAIRQDETDHKTVLDFGNNKVVFYFDTDEDGVKDECHSASMGNATMEDMFESHSSIYFERCIRHEDFYIENIDNATGTEHWIQRDAFYYPIYRYSIDRTGATCNKVERFRGEHTYPDYTKSMDVDTNPADFDYDDSDCIVSESEYIQ